LSRETCIRFTRSTMKTNEGSFDRIIRVLLALGAVLIAFVIPMEVTIQYTLFGLALILGTTAMVGFCPLYAVLGINSCPAKKA